MLLRMAYLGITNAFALLRLLPGSDRNKDVEILARRHQLAVLHRQLDGQRVHFDPADRAWLAALLHHLPRATRRKAGATSPYCTNSATTCAPACPRWPPPCGSCPTARRDRRRWVAEIAAGGKPSEAGPDDFTGRRDVESPEKIFQAAIRRQVTSPVRTSSPTPKFGGETVRWLHRLITESDTLTRVDRTANGVSLSPTIGRVGGPAQG